MSWTKGNLDCTFRIIIVSTIVLFVVCSVSWASSPATQQSLTSAPDFQVSLNPENAYLDWAYSCDRQPSVGPSWIIFNITVSSIGNFSDQVALIYSVTPDYSNLSYFAIGEIEPNPVTPPPNGAFTSTLNLTIGLFDSPPDRDFLLNVTVTGTTGNVSRGDSSMAPLTWHRTSDYCYLLISLYPSLPATALIALTVGLLYNRRRTSRTRDRKSEIRIK